MSAPSLYGLQLECPHFWQYSKTPGTHEFCHFIRDKAVKAVSMGHAVHTSSVDIGVHDPRLLEWGRYQ